MGARPLAAVIQEHIKKPLADEVLFGKLKKGGAVRVIVVDKENGKKALGFEFPEGPVTPKPEKDVAEAKKAREKRSAAAKKAAVTRKATIAKARKGKPGGGGGPSGPGGAGPKGGDPLGGNPVRRQVAGCEGPGAHRTEGAAGPELINSGSFSCEARVERIEDATGNLRNAPVRQGRAGASDA